jgi:hypothetical protein
MKLIPFMWKKIYQTVHVNIITHYMCHSKKKLFIICGLLLIFISLNTTSDGARNETDVNFMFIIPLCNLIFCI